MWRDIKFGLRMLGKAPGFTAIAILTLALGMGANAAIFSLVDAVLLRSLPVKDPSQLMLFRWRARKGPNGNYSFYGDCEESKYGGCSLPLPVANHIRARVSEFSGLAVFTRAGLKIAGNGPPTNVRGDAVSGDYFSTLGVTATLGRPLEPSDDRPSAPPAVMLSYSYWRSTFGGQSLVVGRTILLNKVPFTIVGVAEPSFTNLSPGMSEEIWLPISMLPRIGGGYSKNQFGKMSTWSFVVLGRLKPGASRSQAQAAANLIFRDEVLHVGKDLMKASDEPELALVPAQEGLTGLRRYYATELDVLMFGVGMILLIACANVAGLLVARGTMRQKEIAVRLALGAGRGRIVRQLLTEAVLLSASGGVLGIAFAYWGVRTIVPMLSLYGQGRFPFAVPADWRVLLFVLGVALLSGVFFGLAPALESLKLNVTGSLKENAPTLPGGARRFRRLHLSNALVVAQVGLSVVVLVGAGLLVRTLEDLRSLNPGFDTHNLLLFRVHPAQQGYKFAQVETLYRELQGRLSALPGVTSVGYSMSALLNGSRSGTAVKIVGRSYEPEVPVDSMPIGPNFLRTMRIPLVAGRRFSVQDFEPRKGAPEPVLVNETFARKYLSGGNPLGQKLSYPSELEIVGVVGDTKYDTLRRAIHPTVYFPYRGGSAVFELRTASDPTALVSAVRQIVKRLRSYLPLENVRTQSEEIDQLLWRERMVAKLSGFFAILALALACMGLYGLLSYEVTRRTREIGVRRALGAQEREVLRLVIREGMLLAGGGIAFGIGGALAVTRFLRSMLFEIKPTDPATFAGVAILLALVALLACYVPARRAMKVDPMEALRYE